MFCRDFVSSESRGTSLCSFMVSAGLVLLLGLTITPKAFAQNIQNADQALDLGTRSSSRVNPITRGVNFDIPLGSFPGRSGVNVPVTLSYSSKVWAIEYEGYNSGPPPPHGGMTPFTIV